MQPSLADGITTVVELYYPPLDAWFEVRAYTRLRDLLTRPVGEAGSDGD